MINTFLALLLFSIPGALAVLLIRKKVDVLELFACSFCLGVGICTYLMFFISAIRLPLEKRTVLPAVLGLIFLLGILLWKTKGSAFHRSKWQGSGIKRFSWFLPVNALLITALLAILVTVFLGAWYWPIYEWDALYMHHFKARAFDYYKTILPENCKLVQRFYPLMIPLVHTWMIEWNVPWEKVIYPLFLISLILSLVLFFRSHRTVFPALLSGLIVASTPLIWEHAQIIYLNFPAPVYFSIGLLYFYEWMLRGGKRSLLLGNLFLAFCCWTRSEALLLAMIVWGVEFLLCLAGKRFRDWIMTAVPCILLSSVWSIFLALTHQAEGVGGASSDINASLLVNRERWKMVYDAIVLHLESFVFGGFWWLIIPVIVLAIARRKFFNLVQVFIGLAVFMAILAIACMGDYNPGPMVSFLDSSLMRLFMYLIPWAAILLATQWLPGECLTWKAFRQGELQSPPKEDAKAPTEAAASPEAPAPAPS
jgi:hypothetical protein